MEGWQYISIVFVLLAFQAWTSHSQCVELKNKNDTISNVYSVIGNTPYRKCWKIYLPSKTLIEMSTQILDIPSPTSSYTNEYCQLTYVKIIVDGEELSKFCRINSNQKLLTVNRNRPVTVEVEVFVDSQKYSDRKEISFRWNYNIYLSDPSVLTIKSVAEARLNAIEWLKNKHTPFWGWKEDTPKAVTALFLSGNASFNGTMLEEVMAKQTELRIALALKWNTINNQQLSTFINALLVICLNPRRFYGYDLVNRLKNQVESSGNFTHPAAYLALCNANETWPLRSTTDLSDILSSDSDYPFVRDIQAFAIMALSCISNRTNFLNKEENANLKSLYTTSISRIKNYQQADGSFGNVHTTSLLTQALLSSDKESINGWNLTTTIHYLMRELNESSVDFLTVYTALPILNGKSLSDIAAINCSANTRRHGDGDLVSEMKDNLGPKIRVQYSLYIGDQKDVMHTISLRVPKNSSAYKVMQLAGTQEAKYQFKVKTVSGKMYVYEIANIPNDPEDGKFWLLYLKLRNDKGALTHSTTNPDEIILNDGDHLIMWYKIALI